MKREEGKSFKIHNSSHPLSPNCFPASHVTQIFEFSIQTTHAPIHNESPFSPLFHTFPLPSTYSSSFSSSSSLSVRPRLYMQNNGKRSLTHFIFTQKPHNFLHILFHIIRRRYFLETRNSKTILLLRSTSKRSKERARKKRRQCEVNGKSAIFYE